jgi:uncharacterized membrane protein
LGTKNFVEESPSIILKEKPSSLLDLLSRNPTPIILLTVAAACSSAGFYLFKRRGRMQSTQVSEPRAYVLPSIESDEEKIVNLLRSSNGTLHQSVIVEQCKFSKAKTSQLLAALECKGTVRREKKGRDKIVVLAEQDSGAKSR